MTQFTSFVAVEEQVVTKDGKPQRVEVPVEMPEGVSYEGVFGNDEAERLHRHVVDSRRKSMSSRAGPWLLDSRGGIAAAIVSRARAFRAPPPPPGSMPVRDGVKQKRRIKPAGATKKPTGERAVLESKLHPGIAEGVRLLEEDRASGARQFEAARCRSRYS